MRIHSTVHSSESVRILKGTIGIAVLAIVLFVFGVGRMGAQISERKETWKRQKEETQAAAVWVSEWEGVRVAELDAWHEIGAYYDATISREDARLTFAEELNRIGLECGIEEISLTETGDGNDGSRAWEQGGGTLWGDEDDSTDEIRPAVTEGAVPYRYKINFPASYGSFVHLLDRIEKMKRPVEMHSVFVRRDGSMVWVEMELSTYGKVL